MNCRRLVAPIVVSVFLFTLFGAGSPVARVAALSLAASSPHPCSIAGLQISVSWHTAGKGLPGGGGLEGAIRAMKKGGGTCTLSGWPQVRVLDAALHRLPIGQRNLAPRSSSTPTVTLSAAGAPKPRAIATLSWLNWCKGTIARPISVAIRLPNKPSFHRFPLTPGARLVASCVNPTATSVVDVTPFAAG